ncbi:hypothetical protein Lfu02_42700 [Longispora fulva]|uniref:Uncharacterized protein n=1 Tax=Longispora fulva TaxID=619741 RepID=A0A8J7GAC0_9ACTN|nr:hypothetical protein [Longispora fulva]MBG6136728.1 hypothetical protein [Longispora fulva]GIG59898.1 hypothetical protein Lfu02_42700 [Longispora fulva]
MQPKKKATIAASQAEAEYLLTDYCESIDFNPQWTTPEKWAASLRIACNPKEGVEIAQGTLLTDMMEVQQAAARTARQVASLPAFTNLCTSLNAAAAFNGQHVQHILTHCRDRYISGGSVNLGYGVVFTRANYTALQALWTQAATPARQGVPVAFFTAFDSGVPQNKAALGKGSVGATLAKREWQGNLFVRIGNVRFNMHIDIDK